VRYVALACDYDGTIADDGAVSPRVVEALERVKESGRATILVTGRELDDLERVFDRLDLFDRVVAENGAVLSDPATKERRALHDPPPPSLVEALRAREVEPLAVGNVIVATREPHQQTALEVIHELGLERQVIFNKGAVMILPSGVNKASGLAAALDELRLSPHNVVGIGDAENDHAFLDLCELSVAVEDALPAVKDRSDHVTGAAGGDGVVGLIEAMIEDDLVHLDDRLRRHDIAIGTHDDEEEPVALRPYRTNVLITGPSGSGKSTLTTGLIEGLIAREYQFLLIDPEGDYDALEGVVVLGTPEREPTVEEALDMLGDPRRSLVLDLLGIRLQDRPAFLERLLPRVQELRSRTGRPHWIVVDEAHHMLPSGLATAGGSMPRDVASIVFVTVHADAMSREALEPVNVVITPAKGASESLERFTRTAGREAPADADVAPGDGEAVIWFADRPPFAFRPVEPRQDLKRHRRKYAEGDLEEDAFYFTGPEGRLNLRVQNLILFSQIAEGIDVETWAWHLERGDYERWFRDAIGDDHLADVTKEAAASGDPAAARDRILGTIAERYTLPAEAG
jgi:hydroxymethylpyrimidine pyrophosphatase-like HAD family hydrolase/energy-coupling factor transporter ATP-binding protein EcfA2